MPFIEFPHKLRFLLVQMDVQVLPHRLVQDPATRVGREAQAGIHRDLNAGDHRRQRHPHLGKEKLEFHVWSSVTRSGAFVEFRQDIDGPLAKPMIGQREQDHRLDHRDRPG